MALVEGSGTDNAYTVLKDGEVTGYAGQATVSGSQGMADVISGIGSDGRCAGVIVSATIASTAVVNATNFICTYLQDPSAAQGGIPSAVETPPRAAQVGCHRRKALRIICLRDFCALKLGDKLEDYSDRC